MDRQPGRGIRKEEEKACPEEDVRKERRYVVVKRQWVGLYIIPDVDGLSGDFLLKSTPYLLSFSSSCPLLL